MPEKYYYSNEEFDLDTNVIQTQIEEFNNPHLVALYRGGLPLGVKLSNTMGLPLSIVNFQSYDGDSSEPILAINDNIKEGQTLVIVDDILDTANSIKKTKEMLKQKFDNPIKSFTLVGNDFRASLHDDTEYITKSGGQWVVFPWETKWVL